MDKKWREEYYKKNTDKIKLRSKLWYWNNKDRALKRLKITNKIWQIKNKEKCRRYSSAYVNRWGWTKTYRSINSRIKRSKIRNFLKIIDLKYIWFRDKANLMKKPFLKRIDESKPYAIENCQYKEFIPNFNLGRKHSEEAKKKISTKNKGRKISIEHRRKISDFMRGNVWNKGKKRTNEFKQKMSIARKGFRHSLITRNKISLKHKGRNNYSWKGGITPQNKIIRRSLHFKIWREAVFTRDNYTCQECKTKGGILHPHHIKSFANYPELRFEITNGITLCKTCHFKLHKKTVKIGKHIFYK